MKICRIREGSVSDANIIVYPDGQRDIQLNLDFYDNCKELLGIQASIRNFSDLELLLLTLSALRRLDFYVEKIRFVYLFGMRSDRCFGAGQSNYFKDIVGKIIKNIEIPIISIDCPHSMLGLHQLSGGLSNIKYWSPNVPEKYQDYIKIGADQSASHNFRCDMSFIKVREKQNVHIELSEMDRQELKNLTNKKILIVDDLCDGGATFIAGATYLRSICNDIEELNLYVHHGLFTKGVDHVAQYFDKIITTTSYQTINHPKVELIEVFNEN